MGAIPGFILKRLYVSGSLRTTAEGFEFALRNFIGTGTVMEVISLEVDGTAHPRDAIVLAMPDGSERPGSDLRAESPLALDSGSAVRFRAAGRTLGSGRHTLKLSIRTREMGVLDIPITDSARDGEAGPFREPAAQPALSSSPPKAARPLKIALIGAGSTVFARQLMTDILCTPGLESGTFTLVDIDSRRLDLARRIGQMLIGASGRSWRVEASTDRQKVMKGCDYVINSIEVAGLRNVRHDYDIPLKYGVDQCIGDTIGPGGLFKMLRTGPAWREILVDVERLCPSAVVMNYTNPMSALTLLALRATGLKVVGLCHSVLNTADQLAG
jgi:hypothetical protein